MKRVIILCGIPGSGKTFLTNTLRKQWRKHAAPCAFQSVSADQFWEEMDVPFNPARLGDAHAWCFRRFMVALQQPLTQMVVVDNTNLTTHEIAPYYLAAQAFNFDVEIQRLLIPHEIAWSRQTHGVPLNVFMGMFDRFTQLPDWFPPYWRWSDI